MRLVSAIYDDFYPFEALNGVKALHHTCDPADLKEGDVLIVWGGADISPTLYNKKVSAESGATDVPSWRDTVEWNLMQRAKELSLPIIGVCRGAQMLCALAGGYLIQHVSGHSGQHMIDTYDGKQLNVNSIHHQMLYPFEVDHQMLAWSSIKRSNVYVSEDTTLTNEQVPVEPEFVYFPKVKGFAIQWHPEMMHYPHKSTDYVFEFIDAMLENYEEVQDVCYG